MLSQGLKACVGKYCDLKESQCGLLKWSCRRHRRSEDSFGTYLGACPKKNWSFVDMGADIFWMN